MTEFQLYLRIAKKWWWLALAVTLLASATGWGYASTIPSVYQASASLLVSVRGSADDYGSVMASEKMAETYKGLLTKRPVIEQAAHSLSLDPEQVASKVEARLISRTLIIELVVKDSNPHLAAAIANSIVYAFMDTLRDTVSVRRGDIAVVELATPPATPVSPQITRIVVVAGMAGFVLAAGMASGVEFARDPLESVEDVHRRLSLPALAVVPRHRPGISGLPVRRVGRDCSRSVRRAAGRRDGMPISLYAPDSAATEAYRTLRTWIQFSYRGDVLPTLLVTSPLSGKDAALVAANLGVVLAQAGLKTLLLDANLRQSALQQMCLCQGRELSTEPGLSELLVRADDWFGYVIDTDVPGLHLIPGGLSPSDPLGLLSSPRMAHLVRQLEQHFQVLLICAPPVLAAADALVLATLATGTTLVIESGTTSGRSARQALALLENAEINVLGAVLTGARTRSLKSGAYSDLGRPAELPQLQVEAEMIGSYRL